MADPFGLELSGLPPEMQAEYLGLKNRRSVAQAMMQQGMQPLGGARSAGRFMVAPNPLEVVGKIAQAYVGGQQTKEADKRMAALGENYHKMYADEVARISKLRDGSTPREIQAPTFAGMTGGLDEQDMPTRPEMFQDVKPASQRQVVDAMMGSKFKDIRNVGLSSLAETMKYRAPTKIDAGGNVLLVNSDGTQTVIPKTATPDTILKEGGTDRRYGTVSANTEFTGNVSMRGQDSSAATQRRGQDIGAATDRNKPPAGFRFTANGNLERIPGGPADIKAEADLQKKTVGAGDVDVALGALRDAYTRLDEGGGIVSTDSSAMGNVAPAIASTGAGQMVGKLFGTKNQSARNDIAMARPALLAALMKATGMSAKQMDSNAELKLWLSTATDPTLDVQSNRRALDNIEKKYLGAQPGAPGAPKPPAPAAAAAPNPQDAAALQWANANPNDPRSAAIKQRLGAQ